MPGLNERALLRIHKVRLPTLINFFLLIFFLQLISLKSYEMITNKSYQTFETVTSSVKTKVKGYGYVPTNAKDLKLKKSDPDYYRKLFEFNPNFTYRIIDPVNF